MAFLNRKSLSLRARITITSVLTIALLTVILNVMVSLNASRAMRNEVGVSLADLSFLMANKLDQYMWSRATEVALLSRFGVSGADLQATETILNGVQEAVPSFSWIGLTNSEGKVIAATGGLLLGFDISTRPVFIEAQKTPFYGDVHEAKLLADLIPSKDGFPLEFVDISYPVFDDDGEFRGVLAAHLSWEWARIVQQSIMVPLRERHNVEMFVVSEVNDTVLLGPPGTIGQALSLPSLTASRAGTNSFLEEDWPNGVRYLTGYVQSTGYESYPGLGWTILLRQPVSEAFAVVDDFQRFIWLLGALFVLIFGALGWYLGGRISQPLSDITSAANRISAGEVIPIPQHKGIKEIEVLELSLQRLLTSINEAEGALDDMELKAHRDPLTGLPNRNALTEYIRKAKNDAQGRNQTLTFLYLDLDKFKPINDTHGHKVGDEMLIVVANRLQEIIRSDELVVRLGGDEFLMILRTDEKCPRDTGVMVAERAIHSINMPFFVEQLELRIGCTIGIAIWPEHGADPMAVMAHADEALYSGKKTGRNRYQIWGT